MSPLQAAQNTGKMTKEIMCLTDAPFRDCAAESVSLHTAAVAQGSPDKHQIYIYTHTHCCTQ